MFTTVRHDIKPFKSLVCHIRPGGEGVLHHRTKTAETCAVSESECPRRHASTSHDLNARVVCAHPDKVRAIGVSNVSVPYLHELLNVATVVPAVNQIESHPSLAQEELVQLCRSKGIAVTAYSPLGSDNAPLGAHPVVQEIARKHGVTPHNILISFHANRPDVNVIPKSVTPERIIANKTIVNLSPEEVQTLFDIEKAGPRRV
ncbi:hypothetical protein FOMPIDRAFT_1041035 [Fomitopsis schrenkii]|uniref:NADP-dependent oxidoreductase domain-containing protein n=1 Tax=Fomitopsis schrenkii TaxID=2126942 RepID=S8EBV5_FOMSC|nr:hypothetical protein FOMPIDRAFT_1041035 [Fomitopsis schrenkii]